MNVDGTNTTLTVITPYLMHQPGTAERPASMLYKEIQQLELGERQAQILACQRRGVTGRVKDEVAEFQCALQYAAPTRDRQPQPCVQLGRTGSGQQHIVEMPVDVNRHEIGWRHDGHDRDGRCSSRQPPARPARRREVGACVDNRDVRAVMVVPVGEVGEGRVPYRLGKRIQGW